MAQQDQSDRNGAREDEVFGWVRLRPVSDDFLLWTPNFEVFQIDAKSETDIGHRLHDHPLDLFREKIPEMRIPDGIRAQVLRVNAERPANPTKHRLICIIDRDDPTVVGVQYKYMR
jgi:hypothetical protein